MAIFSIIIPVYNVEKYITQCMESVINQTFGDFEALVVDDCGQDNSIQIVEEFAQKDNRIKILRHKKNKGLSEARNTALKNAKGKYVVCLDSDDWMADECLEVIYDEFQKRQTSSIWFNARKYIEEIQAFEKNPMYDYEEGFCTMIPDTIASFCDFTWIKSYTLDSIKNNNLNWPKGLTFEDGEFFFKYFALNPQTYIIKDCLINYRARQNSIVYNANRGNVKMEDVYQVLINLKKFYEEKGLYNSYKVTMLKLLQNRIRMCKNLKYQRETQEMSLKLLKEFDFPDEFEYFNIANQNRR